MPILIRHQEEEKRSRILRNGSRVRYTTRGEQRMGRMQALPVVLIDVPADAVLDCAATPQGNLWGFGYG